MGLRFHNPKKVEKRFLYPKPELIDVELERVEGESDEAFNARAALELERLIKDWEQVSDVAISLKFVKRRLYKRWQFEYDRLLARNRARVRELRSEISAEQDPKLHDDKTRFIAPEFVEEIGDFMARVCGAAVIEIHGFAFDDVPESALRDPKQIPELLEHSDHLSAAFSEALLYQNPEKKEVFSSGS